MDFHLGAFGFIKEREGIGRRLSSPKQPCTSTEVEKRRKPERTMETWDGGIWQPWMATPTSHHSAYLSLYDLHHVHLIMTQHRRANFIPELWASSCFRKEETKEATSKT